MYIYIHLYQPKLIIHICKSIIQSKSKLASKLLYFYFHAPYFKSLLRNEGHVGTFPFNFHVTPPEYKQTSARTHRLYY